MPMLTRIIYTTTILLIFFSSLSNASIISAFSSIGSTSGNTGYSITPNGWDVGGSFHVSESGYLTDINAGVFGSISFSIFDSIDNKPNNVIQTFGLTSTSSFSIQHKSFNSNLFLDSANTYWLIATGGDGGFYWGKSIATEKVAKKYNFNTNWNISNDIHPAFEIKLSQITAPSAIPTPSTILLFIAGVLSLKILKQIKLNTSI